MTTRDEELGRALVHGLQPVRVELVEYDPTWPQAYAAVAGRLRGVLGERVLRIEHIGSTSVPGLAAKPVIDVVVGLTDPDDEGAYLPDLLGDGWDLRVREPGHRCLRSSVGAFGANLHCYADGSAEIVGVAQARVEGRPFWRESRRDVSQGRPEIDNSPSAASRRESSASHGAGHRRARDRRPGRPRSAGRAPRPRGEHLLGRGPDVGLGDLLRPRGGDGEQGGEQ